MTEWVISDTHFGDSSGLRPEFRFAEDMDRTMISRWNGVVRPGDVVYHLGDVSCWNKEHTQGILNSLNGKKILCLGNHDSGRLAMGNQGFDFVAEEITTTFSANRQRVRVLLTHYPKRYLPAMVDYVIHGHVHLTTPMERVHYVNKVLPGTLSTGELVDIPEFNINVCVELTNYMPVSIEALLSRKMKENKP